MKKSIKYVVAIAIVIAIMATGGASAALPGSGWNTNVQVQNVGTGPATVQITSYGVSGGPKTSVSKTITDIGGSATFLASTELNLTSGDQGAGIISSDQPLFGILFVTNYAAGTANTASAIVRGIGSEKTATTLNFPLAKKNWGGAKKTTTFYVQNAGSNSTTITATMSVLGGTCTPTPKTYSIPASQQVNFTPQDLGCTAASYGGVTVVSSGEKLAGVVLEHDDSAASPAGGSRVVQGTTGFTPADYDTKLLAPIIKKGWGANKNVTGLQVQNVGPADIPIGGLVISYTIVGGPMGVGTVVNETNTAVVAKGAAFNSLHPSLVNGTLASAEVAVKNPTGRIVGIVNENRPLGTTVFRNTTYSMLAAKDAATKVSLPLVKEYYGGQGGRCTGIQVFAVGGSAIMKLTYTSSAGTYAVQTNSAVASKTFLRISDNFTSDITITGGTAANFKGKNFAVTAESLTSGVKLVAVGNESFCPGATRDEDDANYEGFPLP